MLAIKPDEHVHAEIRDLSLKTMGYAPSAVIGTHSIPRRALKKRNENIIEVVLLVFGD